jgi:hypothetical protein
MVTVLIRQLEALTKAVQENTETTRSDMNARAAGR